MSSRRMLAGPSLAATALLVKRPGARGGAAEACVGWVAECSWKLRICWVVWSSSSLKSLALRPRTGCPLGPETTTSTTTRSTPVCKVNVGVAPAEGADSICGCWAEEIAVASRSVPASVQD